MIGFARPQAWLLALPWLALCLWLWWAQAAAVGAAKRHVAVRFRPLVTRYSRRSMTLHLGALLLLGLTLVAVVAGPEAPRRRSPPSATAGSGGSGGRLLMIFDASASMWATDVGPFDSEGDGEPVARFAVARAIGHRLVGELEGMRFAIASFSGKPTLNLPMTTDRALADRALAMLETHTYYRHTGSSLNQALELVFHFADAAPDGADSAGLQVVILGDGELPYEESYQEALAGLGAIRVPVHTVAIGSLDGQSRVIYDFRDVVAKKEEKRVLREYTTRREDRHFAEISSRTGGRFSLATAPEIAALAAAIRAAGAGDERQAPKRETDWSARLLLVALLGFVAHVGYLTPAPTSRRPGYEFDLDRLGRRPAAVRRVRAGGAVCLLVALLPAAWSCGESLRRRAHRANERGLALDDLGRFEAARRQFEHCASLGYRPEVPTHNLARALSRRGDYSEAHDLFQRAIELEPGLVDAHFNDGVNLYEWGLAERDPRDCQLARTLELWRAAERRFASIIETVVELDEPATRAAENLRRLEDRIAALETLIAEPPAHCRGEPSPGSSGGGAGEGGGDGAESGDRNGRGGAGGGDREAESRQRPSGDREPREGPREEEGPQELGSVGGPLSPEELARIGSELERIASQAAEVGKFYRRTRREQFIKEDWSSPDAEIWW